MIVSRLAAKRIVVGLAESLSIREKVDVVKNEENMQTMWEGIYPDTR